MKYATWRGHRVRVLECGTVRAVILTPLSIRLQVRVAELAKSGKQRPRKDSRKF